MASIRLKLAEEDAKALEDGVPALHVDVSASMMLIQGLDLEMQQYVQFETTYLIQ